MGKNPARNGVILVEKGSKSLKKGIFVRQNVRRQHAGTVFEPSSPKGTTRAHDLPEQAATICHQEHLLAPHH